MKDRLSDTQILELVEDIVCASDRAFFHQHPHRKYRIRPAWDVEIEDFARHGMPRPLPEGRCWWIVVHQIRPGLRSRLPFAASHKLPPDNVPEAIARRVWNFLCAPEWKQKLREAGRCLDEVGGTP